MDKSFGQALWLTKEMRRSEIKTNLPSIIGIIKRTRQDITKISIDGKTP